MKILYLADASSPHTQKIIKYFSDGGNEVHIISFQYAQINNCNVYNINTFGIGKLGYFLGILSIIKIARKIRPDIIHAHYITSYGFLAALANLQPLIITAWGSDILVSPKKSWVLRSFVAFAIRRSKLVTVVASHMRKTILDMGADLSKIALTPFGINIEIFKKNDFNRVKSEVINIISTRSLHPLYDHITLIEAMTILKRKGYEFTLRIVGDGPLFYCLKNLTNKRGLSENIIFLGLLNQQNLAHQLSKSDIYISTAISDGDSASLLEAMACGCFPVATNIPANLNWIDDCQNGLLFSSSNPEALAECLEKVFSGKYCLEDIAYYNRELIVCNADNKRCYKFIESLYSQLKSSAD